MSLKKIKFKNRRLPFIVFCVGSSLVIFGSIILNNIKADADVKTSAQESITQVEFTWLGNVPVLKGGKNDGRYNDIVNGSAPDSKVNSYTTTSRGRIQWGNPDNSTGRYKVYYDAADIHALAEYFKPTSNSYSKLYKRYQEMVEMAK